jgi:hypothetical protein
MVTPRSAETGVREVPVTGSLTIDDDAYFGRVCGAGYAVVSQVGVITVIDREPRVVRSIDLGGPVGDFSVASDGVRWAWVVGDRLWVGDPGVDGLSVPLPGEAACRWQPSGQALWVANGSGDKVRVELRTPEGRVLRAVTVPDEFGESMVRLRHYPDADGILLWVAAGQDGQQSWLVLDDGTALTAEQLPADDCLPAMFGPDRTWFLTAGDDQLTKVSWPDRVERGVLTWAEIDPDGAADGSDAPGGCLMSLPGGFVSWSSGNGRLRTIDLATMSVVDEFAVAGHPVRTMAELFPTLDGDLSPCGDFDYAVPHTDGTVLSVHGRRTLVLSVLRDWSPVQ